MGDRDRERYAVDASETGRVLVLRVVAHGEDPGLRLADALALEEVRVEPGGVEDTRLRQHLCRAKSLLARGFDHPHADPLVDQHACDRGADAAGAVEHDVADGAASRPEQRAPGLERLRASR